MFVVVYHWRLREGKEEHFREGWRRVTEAVLRNCNSLGSRLHRNHDGTYVAYALWPDQKHWEDAWSGGQQHDEDGFLMMQESIDSEEPIFSPIFKMEVTDDLLMQPSHQNS